MLEQIAYGSPQVSEERQRVYQVGDLESLSAVGLYSNEKIVDLKALKIQMHMHEDEDGKITGAKLKSYSGETLKKLSNYEAAMGDAYAQGLGLPRISTGSGY